MHCFCWSEHSLRASHTKSTSSNYTKIDGCAVRHILSKAAHENRIEGVIV